MSDAQTETKWLVWSNEHRAWWRPNSAGYTPLVENAGRYSREDAFAICRGANPRAWNPKADSTFPYEIPVPEFAAMETVPEQGQLAGRYR